MSQRSVLLQFNASKIIVFLTFVPLFVLVFFLEVIKFGFIFFNAIDIV